MPIYEYVCTKCKTGFELMRAVDQRDAPASCPSCGGAGQRLPSVFGSKAGAYLRPPDSDAFRGNVVGTSS